MISGQACIVPNDFRRLYAESPAVIHPSRRRLHLQCGEVQQKRVVLANGLGHHVEQQVCHLQLAARVAAHGAHHNHLMAADPAVSMVRQ